MDTRKNSAVASTHNLRIKPPQDFVADVILIGASTGGPQVLAQLLSGLPAWAPPIVVVQHINTKFALPFAERLSQISSLTLGPIEDKEPLRPGHLYCALKDNHLAIDEEAGHLRLRLQDHPPINGHRPSVDTLYYSAERVNKKIAAVLLTGMGRDGAQGMSILHQRGVYTIAQDQSDCVVFGMPKEAIERNAVDYAGNTNEIRTVLLDIISRSKQKAQSQTG